MDARSPGRTIRTRDAIEQTAVVLLATLVEPGMVSPGPPGAQHVDGAGFRVQRTLSPGEGATPRVAENVRVSYTRQLLPQSEAEPALERGAAYVLFCHVHSPQRLHALKVMPHSPESERIVASAFAAGARHAPSAPADRIA